MGDEGPLGVSITSYHAPERCPFAPNSLQPRLDSGRNELKTAQKRLRNG